MASCYRTADTPRVIDRLRRLLPRSESHLLYSRAHTGGASDFRVEGVSVHAGNAVALEPFAVANGFPAGWVADMLADGAIALVATDDHTGDTLAMAWTTSRPFHVDEIVAAVDPGPGGGYLFGDFVAPAARGRNLQRLLVVERLRRAAEARYACTIIHPDNAASVRSYEHEGFVARATFRRTTWLRRHWNTVRGSGF